MECCEAKVLGDGGLAYACGSTQQDILRRALGDEVELEEPLDERAFDLARVRPVELVEGLEASERRGSGSSLQVLGVALAELDLDELLDERFWFILVLAACLKRPTIASSEERSPTCRSN